MTTVTLCGGVTIVTLCGGVTVVTLCGGVTVVTLCGGVTVVTLCVTAVALLFCLCKINFDLCAYKLFQVYLRPDFKLFCHILPVIVGHCSVRRFHLGELALRRVIIKHIHRLGAKVHTFFANNRFVLLKDRVLRVLFSAAHKPFLKCFVAFHFSHPPKNLFTKYRVPLPVIFVVCVMRILPSGLFIARSFTSISPRSMLYWVGTLVYRIM